MIIVTGGAGFIGSAFIWKLNQEGFRDILVVDNMGKGPKWRNLNKRRFRTIMHSADLPGWLDSAAAASGVECVIHMGACSSTTQTDVDFLVANNINYSARLWDYCTRRQVPLIYASSASTYGDGARGFEDDPGKVDSLCPLNPYGFSKQKFDEWALSQKNQPPFWAGLKFFNVFGPQEYHKGSQSSVVHQWVPQVRASGSIRLFKSYRPDVAHGGQKRDFVYVKDCLNVMWHMFSRREKTASGVYNVGSGRARSFLDLARAVLRTMGASEDATEFIEMPEALRHHYQYFTEANLQRLRSGAGYQEPMTTLEDGVEDYLRNYLLKDDPYL